ncbi:hypothetical protein QYE76_001161 [Lolium multiflorum]|jgi:hypothetical protein|uniref:RING-type domain-containing protein n=1 Tax=Lolium multiflorum TaxID=4521 RepID=A0AAD8RN84_LOLMU|nr:hypothetical protein QYE76_001161 [Lolium multiflorum]
MSRDSVLIGASMAALVVLSLVTFFCSNHRCRAVHASSSQRRAVDDVELGRRRRPCVTAASTGLEEAALASFPTELYSSSIRHQAAAPGDERTKEEAAADDETTCAVCLAEYADGDELRRLPGCAHAFHRACVDQWLRERPSCPLCRTPPATSACIHTRPSEV